MSTIKESRRREFANVFHLKVTDLKDWEDHWQQRSMDFDDAADTMNSFLLHSYHCDLTNASIDFRPEREKSQSLGGKPFQARKNCLQKEDRVLVWLYWSEDKCYAKESFLHWFDQKDHFSSETPDWFWYLTVLLIPANIEHPWSPLLVKLDKKPFMSVGRLLTCAKWDHLEFIKDVIWHLPDLLFVAGYSVDRSKVCFLSFFPRSLSLSLSFRARAKRQKINLGMESVLLIVY